MPSIKLDGKRKPWKKSLNLKWVARKRSLKMFWDLNCNWNVGWFLSSSIKYFIYLWILQTWKLISQWKFWPELAIVQYTQTESNGMAPDSLVFHWWNASHSGILHIGGFKTFLYNPNPSNHPENCNCIFYCIYRNVNVILLCITNTPTMLYDASLEKWSFHTGEWVGDSAPSVWISWIRPWSTGTNGTVEDGVLILGLSLCILDMNRSWTA